MDQDITFSDIYMLVNTQCWYYDPNIRKNVCNIFTFTILLYYISLLLNNLVSRLRIFRFGICAATIIYIMNYQIIGALGEGFLERIVWKVGTDRWINGNDIRRHLFKDRCCCHLVYRWLTGNDISGHYPPPCFPFLPSVANGASSCS